MINDNRMSIIMKAQQDGECGKPMVEIPPIKMVMTWGWSIVGFTQFTPLQDIHIIQKECRLNKLDDLWCKH